MKAELTLDSIKVGDDIVTWNETLANVSSKLYVDTSNEFKNQIILIYEEAGLPYTSIEVTALKPKVTGLRSVRTGEPITADYDAHLIVDLIDVPEDATDNQIEEVIKMEVNSKVDSAVEKLNDDGTLAGAQSNVITVGTKISEIAPENGGLTDGELAAIICSVFAFFILMFIGGFFVMRSMRKQESPDIEIRAPRNNNLNETHDVASSSSSSFSSDSIGGDEIVPENYQQLTTVQTVGRSLEPPIPLTTLTTSLSEV